MAPLMQLVLKNINLQPRSNGGTTSSAGTLPNPATVYHPQQFVRFLPAAVGDYRGMKAMETRGGDVLITTNLQLEGKPQGFGVDTSYVCDDELCETNNTCNVKSAVLP